MTVFSLYCKPWIDQINRAMARQTFREKLIMTIEAVAGEQADSPMMSAVKLVAPIVMGYLPVGVATACWPSRPGCPCSTPCSCPSWCTPGRPSSLPWPCSPPGSAAVHHRHHLRGQPAPPAHERVPAPNLKSWKKWELALFAYQVTDESFAVHSARFARGDLNKTTCFAINYIAQASWTLASFAGFVADRPSPRWNRWASTTPCPPCSSRSWSCRPRTSCTCWWPGSPG